MIKKIIIAALVVCVGVWFFTCRNQAGNLVNLPPSASGQWVAFGDSLTSGVGANVGSDYPSLLSAKIGVPIINKGVPGITTQDALSRVDEIAALEPRVVLLCLGGNDGLRRMSASAMTQNLSQMIDYFQSRGSFVVLIGVRSASFRDSNKSLYKTLAAEKGALHIPNILDGVLHKPSLMSDYIHPNDAGYQAIADRVHDELRPYLPKLMEN